MTSNPDDEFTKVWTGATDFTSSISLILSPSVTGILLLLSASISEELGGCSQMSAPTPSVRLPVSLEIPFVRPITTRINTTSSETARMLTLVRTGRALRPERIIFLFITLHYLLSELHELGSLRTR